MSSPAVGSFITRGMGKSASSMMLMGFNETIADLVKRGKRIGKSAKILIKDLSETYKMSVMLLSVNGDEIINPKNIIRRFSFVDRNIINVRAIPTSLYYLKADIYEIVVNRFRIKKGE